MKNSSSLLCSFLLLSIALFSQERTVILPNATLVVVKTLNEFSAENLKTGQEISCIVAMDVVVDNDTLIRSGAPVFCSVEDATSTGMVGKGGNLVIAIQNTVAVDGKNIVLNGNL